MWLALSSARDPRLNDMNARLLTASLQGLVAAAR
jgi:hypothetical protein